MFYKCKRCGFICDQKNGLRRHLNRKIQCKPVLEDIDIETLKHELDDKSIKICVPVVETVVTVVKTVVPVVETVVKEKKPQYICKGCKKEFKNSKNLNQHIYRYGCKKKEEEVIKESSKIAELEEKLALKDLLLEEKDLIIEERLAVKDAEMDFLKKQIEILMKKAGNNTTNTDNSINDNSINDNKQIHININGFGKEDLSYLTDRYFRELFNIPFSAITTLVEDIHFNPKKPQNWNAKIQDDKTSKALIYNAEKKMWVKREKKEVINEMVEKSYNMLDANYEIQKDANTLDEKGKRKFQNFMNIYDKGNKELDKRYETDVREKLLNFREYHTEQK